MKHSVIYEHGIIAVKQLAQEQEFRLDVVGQSAKSVDEVSVQAVSHIQSQTVYIEVINPVTDLVEDMFHHIVVAEVELDQVVVAFPAFVPEAVIVIGISVKGKMEPVLIRRVPFLLLNIPECPEASAYMIEYAVQNNFDAGFVKGVHNLLEVLVCSETLIYKSVIAGVVSMSVGFENRRKVDGICAEFLDVRYPVDDFENP